MTDDRRDRDWDEEYRSGKWDLLDGPLETARTAYLAACLSVHAQGHVLDLGAGVGHLLQWLPTARTTLYTAVDISSAALERIAEGAIATRKIVADFEGLAASDLVADAIVFNGVLDYARRPPELLARCGGALRPNGVIAICMVELAPTYVRHSERVSAVWRAVEGLGWRTLDRVRIECQTAPVAWEMGFYRP